MEEEPVPQRVFSVYNGTPYSDTAAVLDVRSGKFLYKQEAGKQRAIASISKIATSLVFLEANLDLSQTVVYASANDREGATVSLENGDELELRDVLMATLIPSANNMAQTLSVSAGTDTGTFVQKMNLRMQELGLRKTRFDEPTGLDPDNISTAGNIARLARYAFNIYPEIYQEAADTAVYQFSLRNSGESRTLYSTNKFDGRGLYEVVAFKTGYLPPYADRTLVMQIREIATGHEIIISLLGNPEYNTIFDEAYDLAYWTFHSWEFQNYDS
jgi:D-alanyl-D-alanine carboxypeptidase